MFITFEGIDASGKSTQIALLQKALQNRGMRVVVTKEPGGTRIGGSIRKILLDPDNKELAPPAELLLYLADRMQHVEETILPSLKSNELVLCDRYHDATLAYQGGGRGLDLGWMKELQRMLLPRPDLTVWLRIDPVLSKTRLEKRNTQEGTENCRLENEDLLFFQRIDSAYEAIAKQEPDRFFVLEAEQGIQDLHALILEEVVKRLPEKT